MPSNLNGAFNSFLYSPVCDDGDQAPVSVLSALARHDIDPWDDAARLAQMPKPIAIARLTAIIGSMNDGQDKQARSALIAARLVELLPKPALLGVSREHAGIELPPFSPDYLKIIACIGVAVLFLVLLIFG